MNIDNFNYEYKGPYYDHESRLWYFDVVVPGIEFIYRNITPDYVTATSAVPCAIKEAKSGTSDAPSPMYEADMTTKTKVKNFIITKLGGVCRKVSITGKSLRCVSAPTPRTRTVWTRGRSQVDRAAREMARELGFLKAQLADGMVELRTGAGSRLFGRSHDQFGGLAAVNDL